MIVASFIELTNNLKYFRSRMSLPKTSLFVSQAWPLISLFNHSHRILCRHLISLKKHNVFLDIISKRMAIGSSRALAQEIYREMKEERAADCATPTPNRSSHTKAPAPPKAAAGGGGEQAPNLTAKARALYEHSAVPVAGIAAAVGVTERTIYKYAARENWTPRYRWSADGGRPRGARWRSRAPLAPAKGAAGRFIRRADKGKPFATGLQAADPRAAAEADAACAEAARLSREAEEKAKMAQLDEARLRAREATAGALHDYNRYIGARDRRGVPPARHDAAEAALWRVMDAALQRWEWLEARRVGDH